MLLRRRSQNLVSDRNFLTSFERDVAALNGGGFFYDEVVWEFS